MSLNLQEWALADVFLESDCFSEFFCMCSACVFVLKLPLCSGSRV